MRRYVRWWLAPAVLVFVADGCQEEGDLPPRDTRLPVAQSSEERPDAATDSRRRVVIIGTSLTAGAGLIADNAYPAVLQRMADSANVPVSIVSAGLSGETSAGALRRAEWVLRDEAAVVVIETGANDGLRGLDPSATADNLRALVREVRKRAPSAEIVIAQMEALPNLGAEYTERFRAVFGEVASEMGVQLMPFLLDGVAGIPALNQADGIHPNAAGARRVAVNVWHTLEPLLLELDSPG
jgi:acyl-CoA thioesterase-1